MAAVTLVSGAANATQDTETAATPRSPRLNAAMRIARSGWPPAAVLATITVLALLSYGVTASEIARYAAYVIGAVTVPGTLLWRLFRGRHSSAPRPGRGTAWVEDVAGGTALGWAIELPVYLAARAVDLPLAVLAWPIAVIVAFTAVPRLRRYWRPGDNERAPVGWSWAMTALGSVVILATTVQYYRWHGLSGSAASAPYFDVVYQVALAAELKHHVPPTTPYVLGTPLDYHWFVHGHLAASSWITGVELQTIVYRLFGLPMLAVFAVLLSLTASRLSGGRWWPGALAAAGTFLVGCLSPYLWATAAYFDLSLMYQNLWVSPTQTFGATLFAALLLPLLDRLRSVRGKRGVQDIHDLRDAQDAPDTLGGRGQWVTVVLLTGAVMGAKATYLPMLLAGLGLVFAVRLLFRPRSWRTVLAASGAAVIVTGFFGFATVVVFGGQSHALAWAPLDSLRWFGAAVGTGFNAGFRGQPWWLRAALFGFTMLSWLTPTVGAVAFLARWRRVVDPAVLVLLGVILSGAGLTLLLKHPGVSQLYFWRSAAPYLLILAAAGLAAMLPVSRDAVTAVAVAVGSGAVVSWLAANLLGRTAPHGSAAHVVKGLGAPLVAVVGALLVVAVGVLLARRRVVGLRGISAALLVAAALGTGLPPTVNRVTNMLRPGLPAPAVVFPIGAGARPIPPGGIEAARWLRDHSSPDDVVATNAHCRAVDATGRCDNRHFWIAAFTERRVLVEGWGYTPETYRHAWQAEFARQQYWDRQRLADNDKVFDEPTPRGVATLRQRYGVRWLFVDEVNDPAAAGLDRIATLRHRVGGVAVYSI